MVENVSVAQNAIKQDHEDLKEHTLNRLDALDEKMEWFLSKGQQGAHPLSDRMSKIESLLNTALLLIRNIKNNSMTRIEEQLNRIEKNPLLQAVNIYMI